MNFFCHTLSPFAHISSLKNANVLSRSASHRKRAESGGSQSKVTDGYSCYPNNYTRLDGLDPLSKIQRVKPAVNCSVEKMQGNILQKVHRQSCVASAFLNAKDKKGFLVGPGKLPFIPALTHSTHKTPLPVLSFYILQNSVSQMLVLRRTVAFRESAKRTVN